MIWFDILVGIVLVFALIKGGVNGFVKELASLVALIASTVAAIFLSPGLAVWLDTLHDWRFNGVIAFLLIFIAVAITIHLLAMLINKAVENVGLSPINRLAGAAFSGLKYAFGVSLLLAVAAFFGKENLLISEENQKASYLYKPIHNMAPALFSWAEFELPLKNKEETDKNNKKKDDYFITGTKTLSKINNTL